MSISKNASKMATFSPTLLSYLKRNINESSESSFMRKQIKKAGIIIGLAFLFMISGMAHLSAQKVGDKASIRTRGGNIIYGTLITKNDSIVSIETKEIGLVSLRRNKIAKMRPAIFRADGTYWFENPNASQNLLSPTAFGLRKGEGNYQNTMLFIQRANYGLTKNISIGAGFEIASFLFSNDQRPVFTGSAKLSTARKKGVNTAVGVTFVGSNEDIIYTKTAFFYNATTFGNRDNNVTIGVTFLRQQKIWKREPWITISAMKRITKKFGLVTENWMIRENTKNPPAFIFSVGGRFIAPSITVDFGLVLSKNFNEFRLPWVGVTLPFGK